MDLNTNEEGFIEILRAFNFLFEEGYYGKNFSIGGEEPGVTLYNWVKKRTVHIYWSGSLQVEISRNKLFAFTDTS